MWTRDKELGFLHRGVDLIQKLSKSAFTQKAMQIVHAAHLDTSEGNYSEFTVVINLLSKLSILHRHGHAHLGNEGKRSTSD